MTFLFTTKARARWTARIGAVTLAACTLAACQRHVEEAEPAPSYTLEGDAILFTEPPRGLRTVATAEAGMVGESLPGRIAWNEDRTVRVFTPFGGRVLRVLVRAGEVVKADQPLAEIGSPEFDQALADANRAHSALTLATQSRNRAHELNAAGVVAQKDFEQSDADYAAALAEDVRARNRLKQVGAAGGQTFQLKAPVGGVVVEKAINPGQEIRADQSGAPLFVITDPTHLWVWLDAPESRIQALATAQAGMNFVLTSAAYPDKHFGAVVEQSVDFIDSTTRTFRLRGAVDNPDRLLKGEMFVTAALPGVAAAKDQPQRAVTAAAVLLMGDRQYVFVQDNERRYERVPVQVLQEQVGVTTVLGLPADKEVVTDGNLFLAQLIEGRAPGTETGASAAAAKPPATHP